MTTFKNWLELSEAGMFHPRNKVGEKMEPNTPGTVAADAAEENGLKKDDALAYLKLLTQRMQRFSQTIRQATPKYDNVIGADNNFRIVREMRRVPSNLEERLRIAGRSL